MKLHVSLNAAKGGVPSLAVSALRRGILENGNSGKYVCRLNILSTRIFVQRKDKDNWSLELLKFADLWRIQNISSDMSQYYDLVGVFTLSDAYAAQIITHFLKEN